MKNLYKITCGVLVFVLSICIATHSYSQTRLIGERGIHNHGYINPELINPGAVGFSGEQELLFNWRNSWASFPGSPRTLTFGYNGPIGDRLGLGLQVLSDRYAAFETLKGQLSLAYSIESPTNKVGFGLAAEYIQHQLSNDALNNPLIQSGDDEIITRLDGAQYFDVSFGIHGIQDNFLIYGVTLPSLISSEINSAGATTSVDREFSYIINLGIRRELKEYDIVLEPSIYIKQLMLTPFHVDVNLKAEFLNKKLTGGVGYTIGAEEKIGFLIGAKISSFGFYYSYNISFHDFQQYNNGNHELSLKFNLATNRNDSSISSN